MKLKVNTYGSVSNSFRNLNTEIANNVSEKMGEMPPIYTLHMCKTFEDYGCLMNSFFERIEKSTGVKIRNVFLTTAAQTYSIFDCPETVLIEDGIMPVAKTLEEFEGIVAHEEGHAKDYWDRGRLSFTFINDPVMVMPEYLNEEYCAERNAIEAGYSTGCFMTRINSIKRAMREEEKKDLHEFMRNMNIMSCRAAFMNNTKPPMEQKRYLDDMWKRFVDSRRLEKNRKLLSSREVIENPEVYADEKLTEDFVRKKFSEWNSI